MKILDNPEETQEMPVYGKRSLPLRESFLREYGRGFEFPNLADFHNVRVNDFDITDDVEIAEYGLRWKYKHNAFARMIIEIYGPTRVYVEGLFYGD